MNISRARYCIIPAKENIQAITYPKRVASQVCVPKWALKRTKNNRSYRSLFRHQRLWARSRQLGGKEANELLSLHQEALRQRSGKPQRLRLRHPETSEKLEKKGKTLVEVFAEEERMKKKQTRPWSSQNKKRKRPPKKQFEAQKRVSANFSQI